MCEGQSFFNGVGKCLQLSRWAMMRCGELRQSLEFLNKLRPQSAKGKRNKQKKHERTIFQPKLLLFVRRAGKAERVQLTLSGVASRSSFSRNGEEPQVSGSANQMRGTFDEVSQRRCAAKEEQRAEHGSSL